MLTFATTVPVTGKTRKLCTGANGQKEDAASFFCPRSFDRSVMVAQWYDLRLKTWDSETRATCLGQAVVT